jgi:uncharacterized membrane protein HdeD (DUF308 family)
VAFSKDLKDLDAQRSRAMTKIYNGFMTGIEEVEKSWGWLLGIGMLLMLLGIVCVGTARAATTVSIMVFGWILVFSALAWFVGTFQARSWGGVFLYLLNAIIRGATGYFLLRHPDAGAEAVTILLASLFVVGGIFRIVAAGLIQFPRWGWTAVSGAVAVILGFVLLGDWRTTSTFFIGLAIGIDLILDGVALVGFAGAIHSLFKAQTRTA